MIDGVLERIRLACWLVGLVGLAVRVELYHLHYSHNSQQCWMTLMTMTTLATLATCLRLYGVRLNMVDEERAGSCGYSGFVWRSMGVVVGVKMVVVAVRVVAVRVVAVKWL